MKKVLIIGLVLLIISFVAVSCAYNKEELPEPVTEIVVIPNNPVTPITYTSHIKSMVDNNHCLECHVVGGVAAFRDYTTYSGIKIVALSGELKSRAIDNNGVSMPQGYPPLAQNIKDTLQMWIDQGVLE
jgi:hypothetical protein